MLQDASYIAICQPKAMRLAAFCIAMASLFFHQCSLAAQSLSVDNHLLPYSLPVVPPRPTVSPAEDPAAPYTPLVVELIRQLEPHNPPPPAELANASALLSTHGGTYDHPAGSNPTCHNLAKVNVKTNTTPRIMPLCFSDGLGLKVDSGPNIGYPTGFPSMLMLASTFDRNLANAMGQVEGREGRNLMVTGLLGPQADTDVFINWGRGHHTPGEDPFLNGSMWAAQINGIQGQGLMSQIKHYIVYNGSDGEFTEIQDQAQPSPLPGPSTKTWPLNEVHFACENPLLLTYVLRNLWDSKVFVASDYGAVHSSSGFLQGDDREDPSEIYFSGTNPEGIDGNSVLGIDSTSSTCADLAGNKLSCDNPQAIRVAGLPGPGCPAGGCNVANALANGTIPLSVFSQALARVL